MNHSNSHVSTKHIEFMIALDLMRRAMGLNVGDEYVQKKGRPIGFGKRQER